MTELEKLENQFKELYLKFENAGSIEEYTSLYEKYEVLRMHIKNVKEKLSKREADIKKIRETPPSDKLSFRIKRTMNRPLASFLSNATVDNFTSDEGVRRRRKYGKYLRPVLKRVVQRECNIHVSKYCELPQDEVFEDGPTHGIMDGYPNLPQDEVFVFVSTHNCSDEIMGTVASLDRNVYALIGTTDQVQHNPQMYGAFISGMIYVDRLDETSRKDAINKEERIINSGTSLLKYPEGQFNYSFNELVQELFPGLMKLIHRTKVRIIPVATFREDGSKDLHLTFGEPINLLEFDDKTAMKNLRDTLWSMNWEQMVRYATPINRSDLGEDPNLYYIDKKRMGIDPKIEYMKLRRQEYLRLKWSKDVWYEEISPYKPKPTITPLPGGFKTENLGIRDVEATLKAPVLVHMANLGTLRNILAENAAEERYDFIGYMHEQWDKPMPKRKRLKK